MGTHPIFESDFDCLTECCNVSPVILSANRFVTTPNQVLVTTTLPCKPTGPLVSCATISFTQLHGKRTKCPLFHTLTRITTTWFPQESPGKIHAHKELALILIKPRVSSPAPHGRPISKTFWLKFTNNFSQF